MISINTRDSFSGYHPLVNFIYFVAVLGFTMFIMHPVYLAVAIISSVWYAIYLDGSKAIRFGLVYLLPMMVIMMLINPAFNHRGITILTYLPSGNPLTLESMLYGVAMSIMLISVVMWFRCYSNVMKSDKFIYLFGRIIPALSLVLSMALRFVPLFINQFKTVSEAQKNLGRDISEGSVWLRMRRAVKIVSIMLTWSLENAIETSDSMRSRGYGLKGRTAFSNYVIDDRDKLAMTWIICCAVFLFCANLADGMYFRYYPSIKSMSITPFSVFIIIVYALLSLTPMIINLAEDRKWKRLKSTI